MFDYNHVNYKLGKLILVILYDEIYRENFLSHSRKDLCYIETK